MQQIFLVVNFFKYFFKKIIKILNLSAFKKVSHCFSSLATVFSCREEHEATPEQADVLYKYNKR